jgi:hypothetical protein
VILCEKNSAVLASQRALTAADSARTLSFFGLEARGVGRDVDGLLDAADLPALDLGRVREREADPVVREPEVLARLGDEVGARRRRTRPSPSTRS